MDKEDFCFEMPDELIAQTPLEPRSASRMMVIPRDIPENTSLKTGDLIINDHFYNLPLYLKPNDLLVLNDSRVLPARLIGTVKGKNHRGEFLLLRDLGENRWEIICRPGRHLRVNSEMIFGDNLLTGVIEEVLPDGNRIASFHWERALGLTFPQILDQLGQMPLPPYIYESIKDRERYQTVYSKECGSAAAPTAGLHFTQELLDELVSQQVDVAFVTLHVGLGTFRPVAEGNILNHHMHKEYYHMPAKTHRKIQKAKANGGRIIAVGTTSCRVLETIGPKIFQTDMKSTDYSGETDIFIYPGIKLGVIDGLITNFHLPGSTLIMLVSAILGRERTMEAYNIAVDQRYRFFSFGDAMLIL